MRKQFDCYRSVVSLMLAATMIGATAAEPRESSANPANADQQDSANQPSATPLGPQLSPNPLASHPRLLQLEEAEIRAIGNGSFDSGLNEVGRRGYRLFMVTSELESGTVGFHLFTFPRWNLPGPPPTYQFKRIDRQSIDQLGNGKLADGLSALEREDWNLAAVTTIKNGAIGWYYFEREVRGP